MNLMKRLYTLVAASLFTLGATAQVNQKIPATARQGVKFNPKTNTTVGVNQSPVAKPHFLANQEKMIQVEELVGTSIYDLQTNNSVQNRIIADDAGVAATFTFSATSATNTYPDRGTGYNYRTAGVWQEDITSRIESMRTGWPSIIHTASNAELVLNHSGSGGIKVWKRNTIGSGTWTNTVVPTPVSGLAMLWPRAVAGGPDGNTIHMICVTDPTGAAYPNGMTNALLYNRSTDGGATWDLTEVLLPGEDSSIVKSISADTYAIYSRGNKVAIATFGELQDSYLWTSNDNGSTWTQQIIWDFPIDNYTIDMGTDIELDGIQDTILSTDGAGAVYIDASDVVHAAFGSMFYTDDLGVVDSVYSYFPLTGSILYWNESMTDPATQVMIIGEAVDTDATIPAGTTEVGQYGNSGVNSHPQFAEAADGTLFCTFSGINDLFFNGQEYLNHIWAVKSDDGGVTWSATASDITPDAGQEGFEYVYASTAPFAYGDKIHLIVQRDLEPGIHVQPEAAADPITDNDQIYVCISLDLNAVEEVSMTKANMQLFPNPANNLLNIKLPSNETYIAAVYNVSGQIVKSINSSQVGTTSLDISSLAPGVYEVKCISAKGNYISRFVKN
jgi:Secretion system C-terminal sorting domain